MARIIVSLSALLACSRLLLTVNAKGFLRRPAADTREVVEATLLAELAGTLRPSATRDHILGLEDALRPMYTVVPRHEDGSLSHSVVRFVLHRFFAQRGWFIVGLEPGSGAQNVSGAEGLQSLQEWVPSFLQDFLEQLAGGRGISLRELAVLAATLEDLIHKEALNRLEQAFHALALPLDRKLHEKELREVLEVWMMIYMVGGNFTIDNPADVRKSHAMFTQRLKDWGELQEWMVGVMKSVYPLAASERWALDFAAIGKVVEAVGERYGSYNVKECAKLKSELLDIESRKAGRVRLADFYKKGLTGVFEFNEKIEYLRALGALDESDPTQPHVIVANYVGSRPNCLVASSFYAICCSNECEDLLGQLERTVGTELAPPGKVIDVVSSMPSDTVRAPRQLSATLQKRLDSIAVNNGGQVPLHGRLFAQWMHHAYPRECPYPHETGTTSPQTPDEWMKATGQQDSKASKEELMAHAHTDNCTGAECTEHPKGEEARKHHHLEENELPWSEAEELLLPAASEAQKTRLTATTANRSKVKTLRLVVSFAVFSSMGAGIWYALRSSLAGGMLWQSALNGRGCSRQLGKSEILKMA